MCGAEILLHEHHANGGRRERQGSVGAETEIRQLLAKVQGALEGKPILCFRRNRKSVGCSVLALRVLALVASLVAVVRLLGWRFT